MKKLLLSLAILLAPLAASAGVFRDLDISTTTGKATLHISGKFTVGVDSTTFPAVVGSIDGTTGRIEGLVISSATALENTPTVCPAGQAARGIDVFGNATGCGLAGSAIEDEGVPLVQRSTLNFVGGGVTVTDDGSKTVITIPGTGDLLRSSGTLIGDQTTTSTGWTSVLGSTLTVVNDLSTFIRIEMSCPLECEDGTECPAAFSFLVDGVFFDGGTASTDTAIMAVETNGMLTSSREQASINYRTQVKVGIASHDISLVWASPTGKQLRLARAVRGCSLTYKQELEQENSGTVALRSGITDFGAQTTASLQGLVCSTLPCQAQGDGTGGNFDVWVATGTGPGDWLNQRTGIGPFE